jgi:hypothetical protein
MENVNKEDFFNLVKKAGRIYSEKPVDLFVVNKQETNGNDYEKI